VIVGLLLLIAFMGSMFAALNVGIVGGTPATQTTAADVDIVNVIPGISGDNFGTFGISIRFSTFNTPPTRFDFVGAFSFAPVKNFVAVTSVAITMVSVAEFANSGDMYSVQLNGQALSNVPTLPGNRPTGTFIVLSAQDLRVGQNIVNIGITNDTPGGYTSSYLLYYARLTVEYTFLG